MSLAAGLPKLLLVEHDVVPDVDARQDAVIIFHDVFTLGLQICMVILQMKLFLIFI
jgi:hypothetical protein